jgi:hypothetical protein
MFTACRPMNTVQMLYLERVSDPALWYARMANTCENIKEGWGVGV